MYEVTLSNGICLRTSTKYSVGQLVKTQWGGRMVMKVRFVANTSVCDTPYGV